MFAERSFFPTSNVHLPPITKNFRQRIPPPPTPSFSSRAAKAAHIAENVSALKAKYTDYTVWLKNTTRNNREPILKQKLLKNSLCQMGIDTNKAERLVSTCSWYVYQFEKDLKINPEQRKDLMSVIKTKKSTSYKNKTKKTKLMKDHTEDSTTAINSFDQDDSFLSISRNNQFVLPPIHVPDTSTSSRLRRVDFNDEQRKNSLPKLSTKNKTRLKPLSIEQPNPLPPLNLNSSSSSSLRRNGFVAGGQTRSILRKQTSLSSSNASTEITHQEKLTPASTVIDDIPLGTRSQLLFGGSECFAQIMNELEQHEK